MISLETLVRSSGTCIIHDIILYNRVNKRRALATGVSPHTSKWFHQRRSVDLATCTGAPFCMLHAMCGVRLYSSMWVSIMDWTCWSHRNIRPVWRWES